MTHQRVEYPLLGEPPVVEFINTLYRDADGVTDFLANIDLARGWFGAVAPTIIGDTRPIDGAALEGFVELRDAIRAVFDSDGGIEVADAVAVLESAFNASPSRVAVIYDDQHRLLRRSIHDISDPKGTAALLADQAITLATAQDPGQVLICDRPGCHMRYFQQHRRRRYCNPACANSDRQTRFQQRHKN